MMTRRRLINLTIGMTFIALMTILAQVVYLVDAEGATLGYGFGKVTSHEKSYERIQALDLEIPIMELTSFRVGHIDWRADLGLIRADDVHPMGFTTAMVVIPIKGTLEFQFGGGLGYIHRGHEIDGLGNRKVAGTIRAYISYGPVQVGVLHFSKPWENDGGRNLYEARLVLAW